LSSSVAWLALPKFLMSLRHCSVHHTINEAPSPAQKNHHVADKACTAHSLRWWRSARTSARPSSPSPRSAVRPSVRRRETGASEMSTSFLPSADGSSSTQPRRTASPLALRMPEKKDGIRGTHDAEEASVSAAVEPRQRSPRRWRRSNEIFQAAALTRRRRLALKGWSAPRAPGQLYRAAFVSTLEEPAPRGCAASGPSKTLSGRHSCRRLQRPDRWRARL
jgi:hypothetical protein